MKTIPRTSENAKLWNIVVEQNGDRSKRNIHRDITIACTEQPIKVHFGKILATAAIDNTRETKKK